MKDQSKIDKILQDIHMSSLSLNASLRNLKELTGDLTTMPHLVRLLKDTDIVLKIEHRFKEPTEGKHHIEEHIVGSTSIIMHGFPEE